MHFSFELIFSKADFFDLFLILVFMFILECKELSQCRKLCRHGFLPPKNGSVIQCECKPKPDGVSMRYSFFHFDFN